jgi:hypothetical protein
VSLLRQMAFCNVKAWPDRSCCNTFSHSVVAAFFLRVDLTQTDRCCLSTGISGAGVLALNLSQGRSRQPNPLPPFPVKEGGTENFFGFFPSLAGPSPQSRTLTPRRGRCSLSRKAGEGNSVHRRHRGGPRIFFVVPHVFFLFREYFCSPSETLDLARLDSR